jgi:hypothetical protein
MIGALPEGGGASRTVFGRGAVRTSGGSPLSGLGGVEVPTGGCAGLSGSVRSGAVAGTSALRSSTEKSPTSSIPQ